LLVLETALPKVSSDLGIVKALMSYHPLLIPLKLPQPS
jgi:hypothetical protein